MITLAELEDKNQQFIKRRDALQKEVDAGGWDESLVVKAKQLNLEVTEFANYVEEVYKKIGGS